MLDEDRIQKLLESLEDKDPHLRIFTINSIVDNEDRKEALPAIIKLLYDEVPSVRSRAAWALGKIGDMKAMEPLIELVEDKDMDVRKHTLRALGEIMAFDAIPYIVKSLEDEEWEVRGEAAVVLEYMGWVPTNDKEKVLILIAKEKWQELLTIQELHPDDFIHYLKDKDNDVRAKAAWILGEIGNPKTIQILYDIFMTDTNEDVKESAAISLVKIGGKEVTELLVVALHDENWLNKKIAATALGEIKNQITVKPLMKLLKDDNAFVRKSALKALKKITGKK
ncbi:MAG: HEAT repeat domain-containing protein [Candidatus Heimdallarchaeaceae archaeon]